VTNKENFFPFKTLWIRLDVDEAVALRNRKASAFLNMFKMKTMLPIPFFLNSVKETKEFLSNYLEIPRIWFFRGFNCPKEFDEFFGLHVTKPETFDKEYRIVESKLGEFKYFTRHGFSKYASGRLWKTEEVRLFERKYNIKDLSDLPHFTVGRGSLAELDLTNLNHILFHTYLIRSHKEELKNILTQLRKWDSEG